MGSMRDFFRAVGAWFGGMFGRGTKNLYRNPVVVEGKYDDIIRKTRARIQEYKTAVSRIDAERAKKERQLAEVNADIDRLKKIMSGALARTKKLAQELTAQGLNNVQIEQHADYLKHKAAYTDTKASLARQQARVDGLKTDAKNYNDQIEQHLVMLQGQQRKLDDLKVEAAEAVARLISAEEQKELADLVAGLSTDTTGDDLRILRDTIGQAEAEARIAQRVAGTDAKMAEAEYMAYAHEAETDDEFAQLVGLSENVEQRAQGVTETPVTDTKKADSYI